MEVVIQTFPILVMGALVTLEITLLSVAIGCIIGLAVGLSRLSGLRLLRLVATAYVDFFRGTPLLVQIMIVYFGLPQVLRDTQSYLMANFNMPQILTTYTLPVFLAAVISCSLNSGAYIAGFSGPGCSQ